MKSLNPLLVTTVAIAGLGEAIPFRWLIKRVEPAFTTITLGPGATSYQLHSGEGWENDPKSKARGAKEVLSVMKKDGLFTAVILQDAKTSCVGLAEGKTTPDKFVLSDAKDAQTCILTNGGFFITGGDPYLRSDYNGQLLDSASLMYFSVGETSVSPNHVPVPGAHEGFYHRLQGDDGSYLTCGPDLKQALDRSDPDYSKANKLVNRLHHFAKTWEGKKIHSPV